MPKGKTRNPDSKLNLLLKSEGLTPAKLIAHSKKRFDEGVYIFELNKNIVGDVVNLTRDFQFSTMNKILIILNDITGKNYTFNDAFEYLDFNKEEE